MFLIALPELIVAS